MVGGSEECLPPGRFPAAGFLKGVQLIRRVTASHSDNHVTLLRKAAGSWETKRVEAINALLSSVSKARNRQASLIRPAPTTEAQRTLRKTLVLLLVDGAMNQVLN